MLDSYPVYDFVGLKEENRYYLKTNYFFEIGYSKDNTVNYIGNFNLTISFQILYASLLSDEAKYQEITEDKDEYLINFNLTVRFYESEKSETENADSY